VTPDAMTFATTTRTVAHNTATVDPAVLATSNGHAAKDLNSGGVMGATSPESGGMRSLKATYTDIQLWLMMVMIMTQTIILYLL
jgi:hypothetical protein